VAVQTVEQGGIVFVPLDQFDERAGPGNLDRTISGVSA
jgi:hypothetical protein